MNSKAAQTSAVTTVQGERYIPILFQYVSDTERFRGTYILQSLTFPRVFEIFRKIVPLNACVWNAVCTIVIPHVTYSYEQSMPVFEGMFMILSELGLESAASTCSSGNAGEPLIQEAIVRVGLPTNILNSQTITKILMTVA